MSGFAALLAAGVYGAALLLAPETAAQAVREGLALCAQVLLPALFPYLALSQLLVDAGAGESLGRVCSKVMGPLFHLPGSGGAALALGLLGGYPAGAAAVCALLEQGSLTLSEAQALLCFCNNAGPAFILSVAGSAVFGSAAIGFALLGIHALAAILTGVLLRPPAVTHRDSPRRSVQRVSAGSLLNRCVGRAMNACLSIAAYVVFFHVVTALLERYLPLSRLDGPVYALLRGCLELSGGVSALSAAPSALSLTVCAFLLGWGGCCVHAQTAALLDGSGLDLRPYLRGKLVHGLLSALLALGLSPLLCRACPVLSPARPFPMALSLGWVLWTATALVLLRREGCKTAQR